MDAVTTWLSFMACPEEGSATAIAEYLRANSCPAVVFQVGPAFDLVPPFEVRVPNHLVRRARWLWALADAQRELSDAEWEYLATGKLPGVASEECHDDAA